MKKIQIKLTKTQTAKLSEFIEEIYKSPEDSHENAVFGQVLFITKEYALLEAVLFHGEIVDKIYEVIHS